jgi:hypothetical protein
MVPVPVIQPVHILDLVHHNTATLNGEVFLNLLTMSVHVLFADCSSSHLDIRACEI